MGIDIDFEWTVDAKGYRLERGRIIGQGGPKRRMQLKGFDTPLYSVLAKIQQTPEGLLDFVNKFGLLTQDQVMKKPDEPEGDDVRKVLDHAAMMSKSLEMLRGHVGDLPAWQGGPFEYEAAGFKLSGIPLPGRLRAELAPDPISGAWQLRLRPPTLLAAIWLQFGQALTSNATHRSCANCGTWFKAGVGATRRADAKYCSDRCRINHKSLERTRRKRSQ